jgi:hypothetical protein
MKKIIGFILICVVIAAILPIGYFLISTIFLRTPLNEAFRDFLLTFGLMFIVTVVGMFFKKD